MTSDHDAQSLSLPSTRRACILAGLITRKERWGLSIRGWLAVTSVAFGLLLSVFLTIHPFFAITKRVNGEYLIIEGWVPDYALEEGLKEFNRGGYKAVLVTGQRLERGSFLSEYRTFAELGAATLLRLGLSSNVVTAVPAIEVRRRRTHQSASAVADWFRKHNLRPRAVNVLTVGAHARRSRLTYKQVLESETEVGVISIKNDEYDPSRWWRYSAGLRAMIGETAAYMNARLLGR